MPERATDPFKTRTPMSERGRATFQAIAARLQKLNPPIFIEAHIAEDDTKRFPRPGEKIDPNEPRPSTLVAHPSALDGIDFIAVNPKELADAYSRARDIQGEAAMTSMREDPGHRCGPRSGRRSEPAGARSGGRTPIPRARFRKARRPIGCSPCGSARP